LSIALKPPQGTLSINALPWAEVWVDGKPAGETPIGNLSLPIGNHELVFRHPELGEQRRTVTVGALAPVRVGVDLRK
jgi:serine/threonine-protein kinase